MTLVYVYVHGFMYVKYTVTFSFPWLPVNLHYFHLHSWLESIFLVNQPNPSLKSGIYAFIVYSIFRCHFFTSTFCSPGFSISVTPFEACCCPRPKLIFSWTF